MPIRVNRSHGACHICQRERIDARISVYTRDISERFGLSPGTVDENIRYCNDNDLCRDAAEFYSHFKAEAQG